MKAHDIVHRLMRQGRGLLAMDATPKTFDDLVRAHNIVASDEIRKVFRQCILTTPGIGEHLSGVILHDETIRQALPDGTPIADYLVSNNILAGIKVDMGIHDDAQFGGEVTTGLDGLRARLREYKELGATFTKWRAVRRVGEAPGSAREREDASRMAAYALDVLEEGMVPIVEPEVLMDGSHSAADAEAALVEALAVIVDALHARDIDPRHVIIKSSMAVSGASSASRAGPDEVAERTVRALSGAIPEEFGGVVFLSGGQEPQEATMNLNAIAKIEPLPWPITFSYSRALLVEALDAWKGSPDNVADAQAAFVERLSLLVAADAAGYSLSQEEGAL